MCDEGSDIRASVILGLTSAIFFALLLQFSGPSLQNYSLIKL